MKPLIDMLGGVLGVGHQVAYAVITGKKAFLRVGSVDRVTPAGEILVRPTKKGQRSTWKQPGEVVRLAWA